jgi:hypothetical protein
MGRMGAKAYQETVMGERKIISLMGIEFKREKIKDDPSVTFILTPHQKECHYKVTCVCIYIYLLEMGAWGSVVVKALRY